MYLRKNDVAVNSIAYYCSKPVNILDFQSGSQSDARKWSHIGLKDNDLHFHHMKI
jgi:hypothetical protein